MQIYDGRRPGHEGTYTLEGTLADIYLACSDRPITATAVQKKLDGRLSVEAVQAILSVLQQRGLVFLEGSRALALALPAVANR